MIQEERLIKKFKKINTRYIDFLSFANYTENKEFEHMDIDIFIILRKQKEIMLSNFNYLQNLIVDIKKIFRNDIHAFSTFKHEIFFIKELHNHKIFSRPFHLLIYPNIFYLYQWETASLVNTVFHSSRTIFKSNTFNPLEFERHSLKYNPYIYLQALYEAFILYKLSNIKSKIILYDVMKKIEFFIKNLTIETLLNLGLEKENIKSNWIYLIENLSCLKVKNIDIEVIYECFSIRKDGYDKHLNNDIDTYFLKTFNYYDQVISNIFEKL